MHLAEVGELSRAIDEARAALFAKPGNESSVFLAALLWDRNQGNDRNETLALCLAVIRGGGTERFDDARNNCGRVGDVDAVGRGIAILELLSAAKRFRWWLYRLSEDTFITPKATKPSGGGRSAEPLLRPSMIEPSMPIFVD